MSDIAFNQLTEEERQILRNGMLIVLTSVPRIKNLDLLLSFEPITDEMRNDNTYLLTRRETHAAKL